MKITARWQCATVANGRRVSCNYNGWTKRNAIRDFLKEVNPAKTKQVANVKGVL